VIKFPTKTARRATSKSAAPFPRRAARRCTTTSASRYPGRHAPRTTRRSARPCTTSTCDTSKSHIVIGRRASTKTSPADEIYAGKKMNVCIESLEGLCVKVIIHQSSIIISITLYQAITLCWVNFETKFRVTYKKGGNVFMSDANDERRVLLVSLSAGVQGQRRTGEQPEKPSRQDHKSKASMDNVDDPGLTLGLIGGLMGGLITAISVLVNWLCRRRSGNEGQQGQDEMPVQVHPHVDQDPEAPQGPEVLPAHRGSG